MHFQLMISILVATTAKNRASSLIPVILGGIIIYYANLMITSPLDEIFSIRILSDFIFFNFPDFIR